VVTLPIILGHHVNVATSAGEVVALD
jgi:hypothetical protein